MKNTKQKEVILEAVYSMKTHPTADEIYTELKKDYERLSLGTVYRNLNQFAEQGKIRKVTMPAFGDRFDYRLEEHEHILCEKCGKVFDIHVDVAISSEFEDFTVTGHQLLLYGVCKDCKHSGKHMNTGDGSVIF